MRVQCLCPGASAVLHARFISADVLAKQVQLFKGKVVIVVKGLAFSITEPFPCKA